MLRENTTGVNYAAAPVDIIGNLRSAAYVSGCWHTVERFLV